MRRGGMRRGASHVLGALVLASAALSERTRPPRPPGPVLAESDFRDGQSDGWSVRGGHAALYRAHGFLADTLAAKSEGRAWFFVAPPHFLGDQVFRFLSRGRGSTDHLPLRAGAAPSLAAPRRAVTPRVCPQIAAYRGLLTFRLGHAHHTGDELDRDATWGVLLEGPGLAISAVTREGWNALPIAEDGGWTVTKGSGFGHSPSQLQLLTLLSDVRALKIRGNFFSRSEQTYIDDVALHAGGEDAGKLRERVQKSQQPKARESGSGPSGRNTTGHLVGVGMVLMPKQDNETGANSYHVKKLQSGSPAHFCQKIEPGDRLVRVDNTLIDGQEKSLRDVAKLIMGAEGSQITLTLFSYARNETYVQVLERRLLHVEAPHAAVQPLTTAQGGAPYQTRLSPAIAAHFPHLDGGSVSRKRGENRDELESYQQRRIHEHHRQHLEIQRRQGEQEQADGKKQQGEEQDARTTPEETKESRGEGNGHQEHAEEVKIKEPEGREQRAEANTQDGQVEGRERQREAQDAPTTPEETEKSKGGGRAYQEHAEEVEIKEPEGRERRAEVNTRERLQEPLERHSILARAQHPSERQDAKKGSTSSSTASSGAFFDRSPSWEYQAVGLDAFERLLFDLPPGCARACGRAILFLLRVSAPRLLHQRPAAFLPYMRALTVRLRPISPPSATCAHSGLLLSYGERQERRNHEGYRPRVRRAQPTKLRRESERDTERYCISGQCSTLRILVGGRYGKKGPLRQIQQIGLWQQA